jgi:dihydroorotase
MVERDLALAAFEHRPLHVMHISARESVAALRAAHLAGAPVTGEVTPHHLCLTDEAVRGLDPNTKMNPPLRAEEDRQALIAALRDGTISAVATDHAPHAQHEKEVPFEEAPFGVIGLETAFSALYTRLLIRCPWRRPRAHVGVPAAPGKRRRCRDRRAGNVVALTSCRWVVTEDGFRSRSRTLAVGGEGGKTGRADDRRQARGVARPTVGYSSSDNTVFRGAPWALPEWFLEACSRLR